MVEPATEPTAVSLSGDAQDVGGDRAGSGDRRDPAAAVRGLPTLGHRHLPVPPTGPPPEPVRALAAAGGDADHDSGTARPRPRSRPPPTTLAPITVPAGGNALAIISIPKIGVNQYVVEGVDVDDLRKGPGHYPFTQLPGHAGNTAIAGHRTTYGAPFGDLDQLAAGDRITVTTVQGKFTYQVTSQLVVDPSDVAVLDSDPRPRAARDQPRDPHPHHVQSEVLGRQRLVVTGSSSSRRGPNPCPRRRRRKARKATTHRRPVRRELVADADDHLGRDRRRDHRPAVVAGVPPPPALDDVDRGCRAVPRRAVLLLLYLERLLPSNY